MDIKENRIDPLRKCYKSRVAGRQAAAITGCCVSNVASYAMWRRRGGIKRMSLWGNWQSETIIFFLSHRCK